MDHVFVICYRVTFDIEKTLNCIIKVDEIVSDSHIQIQLPAL